MHIFFNRQPRGGRFFFFLDNRVQKKQTKKKCFDSPAANTNAGSQLQVTVDCLFRRRPQLQTLRIEEKERKKKNCLRAALTHSHTRMRTPVFTHTNTHTHEAHEEGEHQLIADSFKYLFRFFSNHHPHHLPNRSHDTHP